MISDSQQRRLLAQFKWRHAGIVAVIVIFAVLALVFSGRVFGTLPLFEPSSKTVNGITYVSGGVGESEASLMKALANDYQLEIVFVQKLGQREEYIADVSVQFLDHHLNSLLNIQTDGPYLLADMPKGRYLITAEYEGVVKKQWVTLTGGKHQKLVFWWPISESLESGSPEPESSESGNN